MSISPLNSPVVVDGIISDEKLSELLALQAEYPELDYKRKIDLTATDDTVDLAKDIGALQVRGGYIVIGVDSHGNPTGELDGVDIRGSTRRTSRRRYCDGCRARLSCGLASWNGTGIRSRWCSSGATHRAVRSSPPAASTARTARRLSHSGPGEVFWRDGTRSTRMSQEGLEEVIARRIADAKADWLAEQRDVRLQERSDLEAAYQGRRSTEGPLGTVNLDMETRELNAAALDFIRRDDPIGLQHLLNEATARARALIDADEIETELGALLDKLVCLAATFLEFEQWEWFNRIVAVLVQIYAVPLAGVDAHRFGYPSRIPPTEKAPRVWLQVAERVFGLGGLAVRQERWGAIRTLTLQLPQPLDYEATWLRHAITMASRAEHLEERQNGRTIEVSMLSLARADIARLDCLRPDGLAPDADELVTSLAQFDVLSNLVAVVDANEATGRVFYPSFARFHQYRIQPVVQRLLTDGAMRAALGIPNDERLASALDGISEIARNEGWRYNGFLGGRRRPSALS